jgi:hypothetical protein
MGIGDWITIVAVLVALGIGVSSIIQNEILQKRERKERLLNEIFEWASDIEKAATLRRKQNRDELWDAKQKYLSQEAMYEYINQVTSDCFPKLIEALINVRSQLGITLRATEEALSSSPLGVKPMTFDLVPEEKMLREKLVALMAEIAKIKIENIA